MTFAELLNEYIGYRTLDEVASACEDKGFKVDPSYLSRLRTGKRPAPDDEGLVQTLAQVCGREPQPLILLANIERKPHETYRQILERAVYAVELSNTLTAKLSRLIEITGAPIRVMNALYQLSSANQTAQENFRKIVQLIGAEPEGTGKDDIPEQTIIEQSMPSTRDAIELLSNAYGIPVDGLERVLEAMQYTVKTCQKQDGIGGSERAEGKE